ncbi:MAG TPA: type II secretion system F family protein [Rhizomicrobium sp.]|jgi:general secretion pathway protein F|nr:type II secretion system F family protein [Rhizomicrobium sp.]
MANFRYKAMTGSGAMISGVLEAPSHAFVIQHLRAQGHYPVSASEGRTDDLLTLAKKALPFAGKPSLRSLSLVTRELASLLQAGLELDRALGILIGLEDIGTLRESFLATRARVRDGASLADALSADSNFPRFYVSMVRAGELGGSLEHTLAKLADYIGRSVAIREAVASALVYPIILLMTAGASIIIILMFVLPEFEPLFADAGKALPLSTRIIMGAGAFLRGYWWLLAAMTAGFAFWFQTVLKDPKKKLRLDAFLLRLPIFGSLLTAIETERLSRTLGTLVANGVPLPAALAIAKDTLRNSVMVDAVSTTASSLREGEGLAARLAQTKVFSPVTLDLIRVGEETGKLDEMLLRQADLDEQRIRHMVDRLIALLVPVLTLFLGVVVAGLIASMMTAILSVNDLALQ